MDVSENSIGDIGWVKINIPKREQMSKVETTAVQVIDEDGFKTPIVLGDLFIYVDDILCEVTSFEMDGVIVGVSKLGTDGKYHANGDELKIKFDDYTYEALPEVIK